MTDIASPGLLGLSDIADSGTVHDSAVALFPESHEFGMMSDIQSATTLVPSPEMHSVTWPNLDMDIGTRKIPDSDDMGVELSTHALRELYVRH